jgi:hypothetical protein
MLVFRKGTWTDIPITFTDPALSTAAKQRFAAAAATHIAKGASVEAATAAAEKTIYLEMYPELRISREEHDAPKH